MAKQITPTTTTTPTKQMRRRTIAIMAVLALVGAVVIGKLAILQVVQTEDWQKRAISQQMSDSVISPKRGTIFDRNMNELAVSYGVYTVIMSPKHIEDDDTRRLIADDLSEMLTVDRDKLYEKTGKTTSEYEVVVSKIELPLATTLSEWVSEHSLTSVLRIIQDYKRRYPQGSLLAPVLGFTGTDNYGLYGLEAEYETELAGTAGRIVTAKDGGGNELPSGLSFEKTVDAQDGRSLVLTIDQNVQTTAERYLEQAVIETGAQNRGICIMQDVNTGAILAMATKGDFDPNDPFEVTDPTLAATFAKLSGDEKAAAIKKAQETQWTNKPVSDYYEPGSVFKVFTSAMALEEGLVSESSTFTCTGEQVYYGVSIKCHVYPSGHGTQAFPQCISTSCNPAFAQLAERIGPNLFFKYYTGFGFTQRTGIDMLSEAPISAGLYYDAEHLGPLELPSEAIGQTFKITPIQLINAMSAVANGGKLMKPYVVQQVLDRDGNVIHNTAPQMVRQVISASTSKRLSAMLDTSVNAGSKNAYVAGYRVAGKTGTSDQTEKLVSTGVNEVWASFAGYAPSDDPQVAILVILDQPQCAVRYGGTISAPVAQKVLTEALPYLGIEPQYTAEELASMNRITPNVVGDSVSTAQSKITAQSLTCKVVGNGSTVAAQVPEGGSTIPQNGVVVIYTEKGGADDDLVTVPDFSGCTLSQANALAADYGLNLQIQGVTEESGTVLAQRQSVDPGQRVTRGTIVTVEFVYQDNIA
ncbi:MAG: penicillin-binding transpeptidase domain-containing protein [Acutalibacteraceae bacterium]|jgi:stage V sporulation protein D (sporulation-specific penicillin-binding protein)